MGNQTVGLVMPQDVQASSEYDLTIHPIVRAIKGIQASSSEDHECSNFHGNPSSFFRYFSLNQSVGPTKIQSY